MNLVDELLGADYAIHNILHADIGIERAVAVLKEFHDVTQEIEPTGNNLGTSFYVCLDCLPMNGSFCSCFYKVAVYC